jgi:hypothetical protein
MIRRVFRHASVIAALFLLAATAARAEITISLQNEFIEHYKTV